MHSVLPQTCSSVCKYFRWLWIRRKQQSSFICAADDEQFKEEKAVIIKEISTLEVR